MTRINRIQAILPFLPGLLLVLACGGGGGGSGGGGTQAQPAKSVADTLTYADPASGDYRLLRNPSRSTASHLVLDLVGPSGSVSGVGFYLTTDPGKVLWSPVEAGDPEKVRSSCFINTILKSRVDGGVLQAGVYQQGTTAPVVAGSTTVLASVALDLKGGIPLSSTATITLSPGKAILLHAPEDPMATSSITLTVGALSAH